MNPEFVEFQVCADASYASEQLSQSESGSNELIIPSQSTSLLILMAQFLTLGYLTVSH